MPTTFREYLSDRLIDTGAQLTLDRQEFERSLATVSPDARGYAGALQAARSARIVEAVVLWLGFHLQPRTLSLH